VGFCCRYHKTSIPIMAIKEQKKKDRRLSVSILLLYYVVLIFLTARMRKGYSGKTVVYKNQGGRE